MWMVRLILVLRWVSERLLYIREAFHWESAQPLPKLERQPKISGLRERNLPLSLPPPGGEGAGAERERHRVCGRNHGAGK